MRKREEKKYTHTVFTSFVLNFPFSFLEVTFNLVEISLRLSFVIESKLSNNLSKSFPIWKVFMDLLLLIIFSLFRIVSCLYLLFTYVSLSLSLSLSRCLLVSKYLFPLSLDGFYHTSLSLSVCPIPSRSLFYIS